MLELTMRLMTGRISETAKGENTMSNGEKHDLEMCEKIKSMKLIHEGG